MSQDTAIQAKHRPIENKKIVVNRRALAGLLAAALVIISDIRLLEVLERVNLASVLSYVICFLLFIPLLLNRNAVIRTFFQILTFSAFFTDVVYLLLGRFPFSYPDAINLFNNPEYASGALSTFRIAFLIAFVGAAAIYSLVHFSTSGKDTRRSSPVWVIGFICVQAFLFLAAKQKPGLPDYLPAPYRLTGNLITTERSAPESHWNGQAVTMAVTGQQVQHIFLIVDESIAAKALGINGYGYPTTPFMCENSRHFINFGEAISTTNFSAGSNFALMTGMRPQDLPDLDFRSFSTPSLYQYAKQAGYKTFLLDAQTSGTNLQNYLTENDLPYIDSIYKPANVFPGSPLYAHDARLAEQIVAIRKLNVPTFTYINKAGAHWPYQSNAPQIQDSSLGAGAVGAYHASIRWNLDRFWQTILEAPGTDTGSLYIYTSDHGENFSSPSFRVKHASVYRPDISEGIVPLLVVDRASFFPANFRPSAGRYAHHHIFPTLLSGMGFDSEFISRKYGSTLSEKINSDAASFLCGDIFGRGTNTKFYFR